MSELAMHEEKQVARPLRVLVPLIKENLRLGELAGMPYYREAGRLLLEAKGQLAYGAFAPWVLRNFNVKSTQARTYMSLAVATQDTQNSAATEFDSLKDFRRRHLGHDVPTSGGGLRQPSWRESVNENIERARREAERLRQEDLTRRQERAAENALALRLIDIGFKILSKELHPDKGGSRDAMARLNRVRDRLKQHA